MLARVPAQSSSYRVLSGGNVSSRFIVPTVAGCVDLVVRTAGDPEVDTAGRARGSVMTVRRSPYRSTTDAA